MNANYEARMVELVTKATANRKAQKENAEQTVAVAEKALAAISDNMERQTRHLYDEIARVKEQFAPELAEKNKLRDEANAVISMANKEIPILTMTAKGQAADEILTDASQMDADTFAGWMFYKYGIKLSGEYRHHVQVAQVLPNKVVLFRHHNGWKTDDVEDAKQIAYIAVKGKDIIGYQATEKAEHRGDYSSYIGWINAVDLTQDASLETEGSTTSSWNNGIKFLEWKKKVAALTEFVPVDMSNKKNQTVIADTYGAGWNKPVA